MLVTINSVHGGIFNPILLQIPECRVIELLFFESAPLPVTFPKDHTVTCTLSSEARTVPGSGASLSPKGNLKRGVISSH